MKSILISVQPRWCKLIARGEKTVEVRKTRPQIDTPFKCYIYCTKSVQKNRIQKVNDTGAIYFDSDLFCPYLDDEIEVLNGRVIGEFMCDKVYKYTTTEIKEEITISDEEMTKCSCLTYDELFKYENGVNDANSNFSYFGLYGWHISELKIYDKPKELNEFSKKCSNLNHFNNSICRKCDGYDPMTREYPSNCNYNGYRPVTRPPQSWCYVEEKKVEK